MSDGARAAVHEKDTRRPERIVIMTERTKTVLWFIAMALVLGSYMSVGYCTAISRRSDRLGTESATVDTAGL